MTCGWPCACDYHCERCGADARYPASGLTLIAQTPVVHLCWTCNETPDAMAEVVRARRIPLSD